MAATTLLHGTLDATIFEAKFHDRFHQLVQGVVQGLVPQIHGLPARLPLLYATVDLDKTRIARTRILEDNLNNPKWQEKFHLYCAHYTTNIVFTIRMQVPGVPGAVADDVGRAYLPVQDLLKPSHKGQDDLYTVDRWLDIQMTTKLLQLHGPQLHVKVQFKHVAAEDYWGQGVGDAAKFAGVPRTFFKQRPGCRLTLYQDAHVLDTFTPDIELDGGDHHKPRRCWEDVYDAIDGARHLVYITGWSVNTEIKLVWDADRQHPGAGITLGELLKRKAGEGVRVLMLVWDDPSSPFNLGLYAGKMKTNDAKTFSYFRDSGVHCIPCPRLRDDSESIIDYRETAAYSHHQKSVIVDVKDDKSSLRRIVSFIGGLDLTNGRYDTPDHSLFGTLNGAHLNDFYQGNIKDASIDMGGPRQPWHDIHCRIEGPAAWDVLHNFQQRWIKRGGQDDIIHNVLWPWKKQGDALVDLKGMEDVILPQASPAAPDGDRESWNVQVFRSIDASACFGFAKTPQEAEVSGLISAKDKVIDRSIQDAYIHAIRRAKRFIYIENQYFLGSSFAWRAMPDDCVKPEDIYAEHTIPRELSLKIVSKIEANEPFTVYVVVPMWPEGVPTAWSTQAILSWQHRTMEMMYRDISKALKARNSSADPRDYVSFFCLGNREMKFPDEYKPADHPPHGSDYELAQKARRGMIYVHSKMMIEWMTNTSSSDSEIAMGAFQPFHLNTNGKGGRGQVHGLRMSLWHENLGEPEPQYKDAGSVECIRMVNKKADENWKLYTSDKLDANLRGHHLLRYPIDVRSDGTVTSHEGKNFFPDTQAPVIGSISYNFITVALNLATSLVLTT